MQNDQRSLAHLGWDDQWGATFETIIQHEPDVVPARVAVSRDAEGRLPPPITFHPDGSATGGRLVLNEDGRERVVAVDWLTGAVSVS